MFAASDKAATRGRRPGERLMVPFAVNATVLAWSLLGSRMQ